MERQDLSLFCRSKTDFAREHTSKEFFLEHQELSLFVVQKPILLANMQEFFLERQDLSLFVVQKLILLANIRVRDRFCWPYSASFGVILLVSAIEGSQSNLYTCMYWFVFRFFLSFFSVPMFPCILQQYLPVT